jgi:uncharacterized protein (TIGR02145 family)
VIKIGFQTIMAENLRYKMPYNCWSHKDIEANVGKYGYLYDHINNSLLAPEGWHIPSKEEWEQLYVYLGNDAYKVYDAVKEGGSSGFNAIGGGSCAVSHRYADDGLSSALFWSSTNYDDMGMMGWYFSRGSIPGGSLLSNTYHSYGLSVRLFRD